MINGLSHGRAMGQEAQLFPGDIPAGGSDKARQIRVHMTPWFWSKARAGIMGRPLSPIHAFCRTFRHKPVGDPDVADSGTIPPSQHGFPGMPSLTSPARQIIAIICLGEKLDLPCNLINVK